MLQHIALEVADGEKAALFFTEILGLERLKSMTLSPQLNSALFGKEEQVALETYGNGQMCVEVFITGRAPAPTYQHICLSVPDKAMFIAKCKAHGVTIITAQKGDRELLFIRDFSGNLYEIKAS